MRTRSKPLKFTVRSTPCVLILVVLVLRSGPLMAQDTPVAPEGTQVATEETSAAASNADALRKAAQNPVASLSSVPVQNKNNFWIDPGYRTQDVLNIRPVIPVKVSDNWNLIIRWITPIIYQPSPAPSLAPQVGVYGPGDMQLTTFRHRQGRGRYAEGERQGGRHEKNGKNDPHHPAVG